MKLEEAISTIKTEGVDAYLYAGPIETFGYDALCEVLESKEKSGKALLYLVTTGGSPNAGYRIARAICHHYGAENFRVSVPAECKSAGTLICIGAHSLVISDKGELGPLDVQFQKQDEIFEQSSGLDILRGMTYLRQEALDTFKEYLLDINSGSGLSTKTASEIASKLVIGLFEPMFAQIDPIRLGEMNAALEIANEYGNRLLEQSKSLKPGALGKLVHNYPTHGFVIDRAEARKLFHRVAAPTEAESTLAQFALTIATEKPFRSRSRVLDLVAMFEGIIDKVDQTDENHAAPTPKVPPADAPGVAPVGGPAGADPAPVPGGEQPPVAG